MGLPKGGVRNPQQIDYEGQRSLHGGRMPLFPQWDPPFLHVLPDRGAAYAEAAAGLGLVPGAFVEEFEQAVAGERLGRPAAFRGRGLLREGGGAVGEAADLDWQIEDVDIVSGAQDEGMLDGVFEFTRIARPGVVHQDPHGTLRGAFDGQAGLAVLQFDEVGDEPGDVLLALAQGRDEDREHLEPVKEILPEGALLDLGEEVLVGGGDDPDVDPALAGFPDAFDFPLLYDPQELHLNERADLGDLVQEDRSPVGLFEAADPVADGPGEGPFDMPEEFAFKERLRERAAVDGNEGHVFPGAVVVDGAGDEFLAGAAFALDEDGGLARRGRLDGREDLLHGVALADDLVEAVGLAEAPGGLLRLVASLLELREVRNRLDDALDRSLLIPDEPGALDDRHVVPVFVAQETLPPVEAPIGEDAAFGDAGRAACLKALGEVQEGAGLPDRLLGAVTRDPFDRRVPGGDPPLFIEGEHPVGHGLEQQARKSGIQCPHRR
ncbi:hypothetical protein TRIP_B310026 [uncultured Desulfatiglans sp.]|nr:hypothetical protein TRIP_B310026 [uncultured Desulfatiglans sp.]